MSTVMSKAEAIRGALRQFPSENNTNLILWIKKWHGMEVAASHISAERKKLNPPEPKLSAAEATLKVNELITLLGGDADIAFKAVSLVNSLYNGCEEDDIERAFQLAIKLQEMTRPELEMSH